MLDIVGPLVMLPTLLSILGATFTAAGVGEVISHLVGAVIPEGNLVVGIIVYCVGMALFTAIMGNAFAAITLLTVGIGAPFVLSLGANGCRGACLDLWILRNSHDAHGCQLQYCSGRNS